MWTPIFQRGWNHQLENPKAYFLDFLKATYFFNCCAHWWETNHHEKKSPPFLGEIFFLNYFSISIKLKDASSVSDSMAPPELFREKILYLEAVNSSSEFWWFQKNPPKCQGLKLQSRAKGRVIWVAKVVTKNPKHRRSQSKDCRSPKLNPETQKKRIQTHPNFFWEGPKKRWFLRNHNDGRKFESLQVFISMRSHFWRYFCLFFVWEALECARCVSQFTLQVHEELLGSAIFKRYDEVQELLWNTKNSMGNGIQKRFQQSVCLYINFCAFSIRSPKSSYIFLFHFLKFRSSVR